MSYYWLNQLILVVMFSVSLIASASISPQAFAHDANPPTGEICIIFAQTFFEASFLNHGTTGVSIVPDDGEFIITQTAFLDQNIGEFGVDTPHFGLAVVALDSDTLDFVTSGFSEFPVSTSGSIGTFVTTIPSSVPAGEYFLLNCWFSFQDEGGPFVSSADLFGPFTVPTPTPEVPVGGEFLPIDSTALVLAGLQTSAIWMLPVLAGVAGSAFGILYIKSRRN